jgi:hypothetical protein
MSNFNQKVAVVENEILVSLQKMVDKQPMTLRESNLCNIGMKGDKHYMAKQVVKGVYNA